MTRRVDREDEYRAQRGEPLVEHPAGVLAAIKRRTHRRERREGRRDVAQRVDQAVDDAIETGGWYE